MATTALPTMSTPELAAESSSAAGSATAPVPMSFPAILRGPGGVSDRFAHLRGTAERAGGSTASAVPKRNRRDEKEGKKWVRRKENARFVGNPHITRPTVSDLSIPVPRTRPTFPVPLPPFLPRNAAIPAGTPATREPMSASAGRFSMSLKGMRKELRGRGVMTEVLVREVEDEIMGWLNVGVWVDPDVSAHERPDDEDCGVPIGTLGAIREVERTHMQLVWEIKDDAFARYIVHCCARYHNVVSFSKETPGSASSATRLTHILRPHVSRPNQVPTFDAPQGLDTPPVTDLGTDLDSVGGTDFGNTDIDSAADVESDFAFSEVDSDAELEGVPPPGNPALSAIAESASPSPHLGPTPVISMDSDIEHDADVEHSEMGSEFGDDDLVSSVASLDITPRADRRLPLRRRSRPWERQRRAPSSPSGSPARRNAARKAPRVEPPVVAAGKQSFYDYLFA